MKRINLLLLLLMLLPLRALAADAGIVRVCLSQDGRPVPGGEIVLYKITQWSCDPEWQAEELAEFAREQNLPGKTKSVDSEGNVEFTGLEEGTYLVAQWNPAAGYYPIRPFLVSLPLMLNGRISMEITAEPKAEKIPDPELPQTGLQTRRVWILVGMGTVFLALGFLTVRKE